MKPIILKKIKAKRTGYSILIECNYCHKTKLCIYSSTKFGGAKFCSHKCYGKSLIGNKLSKKTKNKLSESNKGKNLGSNNGMWKNGTHKDKQGYLYFLDHQHPLANCRGYVRTHRYIISQIIGRLIKPEESPHHINEIKSDNRPENLYLFPNNSEHQRYHRNLILGRIKPITESNLNHL